MSENTGVDQIAPHERPPADVAASQATDTRAGLSAQEAQARLERVGPNELESEVATPAWRPGCRVSWRPRSFTKGAPGMLLERCTQKLTGQQAHPLTPERRAQILIVTEAMAAEALRTLGAAFRSLDRDDSAGNHTGGADEVEHFFIFLGLIGMIDPPHPEARAAVERARAAGNSFDRFQEFAARESSVGIVLLACTAAALIRVNPAWAESATRFGIRNATFSLADHRFEHDLHFCVDGARMAVFFFSRRQFRS